MIPSEKDDSMGGGGEVIFVVILFVQKYITLKRLNSPYLFRTMLRILADIAVWSEARNFFCPNIIREFEAKNFELVTLIHVCLRPKEIVPWHER